MNRAERRATRKKLNRRQRNSLDRRNLIGLACHEAAHAVIGTVLGLDVHQVSVRPRQETWGHTEYEPPPEFVDAAEGQIDTSHPAAASWLEAKAICGLAGPRMHETVLLNIDQEATFDDEAGWRVDEHYVELNCAYLCEATGRDAEEVVNSVEDRTRELIMAHGDTIKAVAQVLGEQGSLPGEQLREIVAEGRAV